MKKYFNFCLLLFSTCTVLAQSVEILPDAKTNLSLPQFSYQQILAIQNPDKGSFVYDSTSHCVRVYNGLSWDCLHRSNSNKTPEFTAAWKPSNSGNLEAFNYELDNAGNIYICGIADASTLFGNGLWIPTVENRSFFVVKYSPQGKALWLKYSTGNSYGFIGHIKIGSDSKLYLLTSFYGDMTFGSYHYSNSGVNESLLVAKMDLNGAFEWTNTVYGGFASMVPNRLSLDTQNNVYICGHFSGQLTFSNSAAVLSQDPNSYSNGFYIKYNTNGAYQWGKSLHSTESFHITDLEVDNLGDIYMGASFSGSTTIGSVITSAGDFDILLMKADIAGNILWAKREGGAKQEYDPKLVLINDNVFVLGGVITPSNIGGVNLTSTLPAEPAVAGEVFYGLFNPTSQTWNYVKKSDNGATYDVTRLKTDSRGNFYTSGSYTPNLKMGNKTINDLTHGNAFFVKGNMLTGEIFYLNGFSGPTSMSLGVNFGGYKDNINLFVGRFFNEVNVGEYRLRSSSGNSFFVAFVEE